MWCYDLRNGKVLSRFEDSHSDDVTHVRLNGNLVLTCSVDGLCCVLEDMNTKAEDDALISVMNDEQSLSCCGWFLSEPKIWCVSDMQHLSVWDWKESDRVFHCDVRQQFNAWNVLQVLEGGFMAIGHLDGAVSIVSTSGAGIALLQGGHSAVVRGMCDFGNGRFCTGGEDGVVCFWKKGLINNNNNQQEKDERKAPTERSWKKKEKFF